MPARPEAQWTLASAFRRQGGGLASTPNICDDGKQWTICRQLRHCSSVLGWRRASFRGRPPHLSGSIAAGRPGDLCHDRRWGDLESDRRSETDERCACGGGSRLALEHRSTVLPHRGRVCSSGNRGCRSFGSRHLYERQFVGVRGWAISRLPRLPRSPATYVTRPSIRQRLPDGPQVGRTMGSA